MLSNRFIFGKKLRLLYESGMVHHVEVVAPTEKELGQKFGRERMSVLDRDVDKDREYLSCGSYLFAKVLSVDMSGVDLEWLESPEVNELGFTTVEKNLLLWDRCPGEVLSFMVEAGDFQSDVEIEEEQGD